VLGSGPREPDAAMVVSGIGEVTGSVSGGCAEGAVVDKALQVIESGEPRLGTFGYSHDDAIVVGPYEARWPPHQRPKGASTK
jgi:xanthine dehydrogenase accessory factor